MDRKITPVTLPDGRTANAIVDNAEGVWYAEWDVETNQAMPLCDGDGDYIPVETKSTIMDRVTESMKEALVETLVSEGWTTLAAWAAADDPDNWQEMADDNVEANVIAGKDDYAGETAQTMMDRNHPLRDIPHPQVLDFHADPTYRPLTDEEADYYAGK